MADSCSMPRLSLFFMNLTSCKMILLLVFSSLIIPNYATKSSNKSSSLKGILAVEDLIRKNFQTLKSENQPDPSIRSENVNLRIMSFNTWNTGANVQDGLAKVAMHILQLNPDIVALQEIETPVVWKQLLTYLGPQWKGAYRNGSYPDSALVTRHHFDPTSCNQTDWAIGCKITILKDNTSKHRHKTGHTPRLTSFPLHFWSVHLDWRNYAPFAACNKKVTDPIQIEAGEYNLGSPKTPGRAQNMVQLTTDPAFIGHLAQSETIPMFVAGDFNSPSHLDWTNETKSSHCGWTFSYPATRILNQNEGFTDSYRMLHPDPTKDPGITWSTVQIDSEGWGYTIPEPQDRIDYIHFKTPLVTPVKVEPYKGTGRVLPKPFTLLNDWPSDHYGLLGDFKVAI